MRDNYHFVMGDQVSACEFYMLAFLLKNKAQVSLEIKASWQARDLENILASYLKQEIPSLNKPQKPYALVICADEFWSELDFQGAWAMKYKVSDLQKKSSMCAARMVCTEKALAINTMRHGAQMG